MKDSSWFAPIIVALVVTGVITVFFLLPPLILHKAVEHYKVVLNQEMFDSYCLDVVAFRSLRGRYPRSAMEMKEAYPNTLGSLNMSRRVSQLSCAVSADGLLISASTDVGQYERRFTSAELAAHLADPAIRNREINSQNTDRLP